MHIIPLDPSKQVDMASVAESMWNHIMDEHEDVNWEQVLGAIELVKFHVYKSMLEWEE